MLLNEIAKLGDKLELSAGSGSTKTKITGFTDHDCFEVSRPTYKMIPVYIAQGECVRFWLFKPNGIFTFEAKYEGQYLCGNVHLCRFRLASEIEKNQRRSAYRLPIVMRASVLPVDASGSLQAQKIPITTVNLSEDGICFTAFAKLENQQNIVLQLRLGDNAMMILNAEILRMESPLKRSDPNVYAARFLKVVKRDQIQLSRFILTRQILERKEKE